MWNRQSITPILDRQAWGLRRVRRSPGILRAAWLLRGCRCGSLIHAEGSLRVVAEGDIAVGDRVQFLGGMIASEIVAWRGSQLEIGSACMLNYGVSIEAKCSVRIGRRCRFGSMVSVRDFDEYGRSGPVVIGDEVWLAHGVVVEPGVRIGDGAVIAAGSVVFHDVPAAALAVGNPAVCMPLERALAA
jgi:acetyltransferase-like isoleucine patch superfamily enzyme